MVVKKTEPKHTGGRKGTVPEQEAFLAVLRTADALMGDLADLLKPHGLSPTQYNALRILRGAGAGCCDGGHHDPAAKGIACREIGDRMITRDPDLTRLLDRLEARGLIARARDSSDRRVVTTRITASGFGALWPASTSPSSTCTEGSSATSGAKARRVDGSARITSANGRRTRKWETAAIEPRPARTAGRING